jgi:hypothetical protein
MLSKLFVYKLLLKIILANPLGGFAWSKGNVTTLKFFKYKASIFAFTQYSQFK